MKQCRPATAAVSVGGVSAAGHQPNPQDLLLLLPPLAQWLADKICAAAASTGPVGLDVALKEAAATLTAGIECQQEGVVALGVAANCRDSQRCLTPLHWASLGEPSCNFGGECAELLLSRGANPNARDVNGSGPLHYAVQYNCLGVCQRLLSCRGVRLDLRNHWGRTALMFAAWGDGEGRSELARALLTAGAGVDARDARGRTALMWAALTGKAELLRLLLASGADWRRRNLEGRTARQLAEREGHAELARLLAGAAATEEAALKLQQQLAQSPGPDAAKEGGEQVAPPTTS